ncbi:type II toxin-antitoxin system PemK/MazF family toxin [Paenibacillus lentus]|uniref:Uncharacterized protein n=1 Tax=Paenibacillus lentus TaxID=1338368 RepID=A0A3S8RR36_9BACL|nr:type II toxin-antitoxin system PemK/MazF family toxin [Paenibacillus lentus]AZK45411.1 hypothetical protein EIM92_03655 [Paenibacillus lentus]
MFPIDKRNVKREVDRLGDHRKKIEKGFTVAYVAESYKKTIWNLMDTLQDADAYSMAQWLIHVDRWIDDRGKEIKAKYKRGEIINVELGAMNFGYEASYEHPAIVMANGYNRILIAPCSSKSFGKGHRDVIDMPRADATGLTENTGVGVGWTRWISKNRILDRIGVVKNIAILDRIDEYLMNELFYNKVLAAHYDNHIYDLEKKQRNLEAELEEMKSIIESIEELLLRHSPELYEQYREIASTKN